MEAETKTDQKYIQLKDGRILGYHIYGDTKGFPIIALHGTPGSRIWFIENDPVSTKLGVKLITLDRPGYGISTPSPNRKIADFNSDINELLSALHIDNFSIFGVSGGGAFALAYAASQNPELHRIGLVASVYEFKNGKIPKEMCWPNKMGFFLANYMPWMLRYTYKQQKQLMEHNLEHYRNLILKNNKHLCESDQQILKRADVLEANIEQFKVAFRHHTNEAVHELRLFSRSWGIQLENIESHVEIWHGEEDTLSPISGLREFIKNIPSKNTHFIKGKGHFLDEDDHIWESVLSSLMP